MNKHKVWAFIIITCVFIICTTILIIVNTPYNIHFSMDNNTLEAIKSINWTAIEQTGRT